MYCKNCGAQIDDKAIVCVSCGAGVAPEKPKTNVMSVAGIVAAGLSFFGFGAIAGIVAVILSSIALSQIKKTGEQGKAFAIVGIVVGVVVTVITVFAVLLTFGIFSNIVSLSLQSV